MTKRSSIHAPAVAAAVSVALLIAGCASGPTQPESTLPEDSAIRLVRRVSVAGTDGDKSTLLGAALGRAITAPIQALKASGDVRQGDGYVFDMQWWCVDPRSQMSRVGETVRQLTKLCQRRGGDFDGQWCRTVGAQDDVLFAAITQPKSDKCPYVEVFVVEPTGERTSPGYITALKRLGYQTADERLAADRQRTLLAERQAVDLEMQASRERARHQAQLPRMRERGATVCREENRVTYRGFVEDWNGDKIKILESEAFLTGAPSMRPGGWQPRVIWDLAVRWRLC